MIERDPTSGTQLAGAASALVEMACVLSNDKGTWTVTTPGKVRVMRSSQHLHVECRSEGYGSFEWAVPCISPRQSGSQSTRRDATFMAAMTPFLLLAPPAAIAVAPNALLLGAEAAFDAGAGPRADLCTYGWALKQFWIVRRGGPTPSWVVESPVSPPPP